MLLNNLQSVSLIEFIDIELVLFLGDEEAKSALTRGYYYTNDDMCK